RQHRVLALSGSNLAAALLFDPRLEGCVAQRRRPTAELVLKELHRRPGHRQIAHRVEGGVSSCVLTTREEQEIALSPVLLPFTTMSAEAGDIDRAAVSHVDVAAVRVVLVAPRARRVERVPRLLWGRDAQLGEMIADPLPVAR